MRDLRAALGLLAARFPLIAALLLSVGLPLALVAWGVERAYGSDEGRRLGLQIGAWGELLFRPIADAALLSALPRLVAGEPVGYTAAMGAGLAAAGRLLKAWLATGVLVLLGLLALGVPGIVLAVRWALVDPLVVLEGCGVRQAMARSAALTRGRRGRILAIGVTCLAVYGLACAALYWPGTPFARLEATPVFPLLEAALDLLLAPLEIAFFLVYREAAGR